jgi:hypothetical protein
LPLLNGINKSGWLAVVRSGAAVPWGLAAPGSNAAHRARAAWPRVPRSMKPGGFNAKELIF